LEGGHAQPERIRAAGRFLAVIARSPCDEAIQLPVPPHESWIASLALAMTNSKQLVFWLFEI
jgi:hypothetical protein